MENVDVLIVGAGPTGLACGIECRRAGFRFVVLEKGCVVQSIYDFPTHMTFFTTPELLEIGDVPMTSIREKPTRLEALKYYRRVAEQHQLPVRQFERAVRIDGADGNFGVYSLDHHGQQRCYRARKVILATGYYDRPNLLGIPGEELEKVTHYYREPHPYYDSDVAVIGGANSAAVAALEVYRNGGRVTLIHRGPGIDECVKYWIKPDLENRIKANEIRAIFNARVLEIQPQRILVESPEGQQWLPNDFVLAMTGYHPDVEFLAAAGIPLDRESGRPCSNPDTRETNVPGIYLAGVLVAGVHANEIFIENGRCHGRQIVKHIAQEFKKQFQASSSKFQVGADKLET